jgi:hypothetical protein
MTAHLDDPKYWRDRGDELRAMADRFTDPVAKAMLLRCAADYDVLADRAETRLRSGR